MEKEYLDIIKEYLHLKDFVPTSDIDVERVKEVVVAKLCHELGILIPYNYNARAFRLFSNVVGEAVCRILNIRLIVGHAYVRLFKYNGTNLVDRACEILTTRELDEAFIDIFNWLDSIKNYVPKF